ncbi:MAG: cell division protein FtsA [Chlorobi bacterium]|nr:cell division protein FtsA [Chlorobiota bacterium]
MKEIITAVDIGTTKIVALAGERDENGNIRILTKGTVPTPAKSVKRGVVLNIETVSQAVKEAVEIAEEQSGIEFKEVFIGIAGQHIKSLQNSHSIYIDNEDHRITQADVDKMTSEIKSISLEPGQEIIDIIPQEFKADAESGVDNPVGFHAKKLTGNYHIIIGEKTSAKNIKKCLEMINIKPKTLYLEPIASAKAVLTEEEKEAGVALIDIGGGTTDIAVFYDGILRHTAVIPFGGNVITKDIKEAYKILNKHAENLKIECGSALSEFARKDDIAVIPGINGREQKEIDITELSKVIQARMEEIIQIINFELINSGYRDKLAAGIALTGGGSLLDHLPQLMKYKTGLDVKISKPSESRSSGGARVNSPKLSTAVGLILLGFENAETFDFTSYGKKRKNKRNKKTSETKKQTNGSLKDMFSKLTENVKQKTLDFFEEEDTEFEE